MAAISGPVEAPVLVGGLKPAGAQPTPAQAAVAPAKAATPTETPAAVRPADVETLVQELNRQVEMVKHDLKFSVDDSSGRVVIQVLDSETDEIIRQIPPDEVLALAERLGIDGGGLLQAVV